MITIVVTATALVMARDGARDGAAAGQPAPSELWHEHYELGDKALNEQYWAEAIEHLTRAIELRRESGAAVPASGAGVIDYFPYFKLGIAYFNLQQYDAALHAFETELRFAAIERSPGDRQNLRTYQLMAEDGLKSAVEDSLAQARALERKGQFDRALEALERAVAIGGERAERMAEMKKLRDLLEAHRNEREVETHLKSLVNRGRVSLAAGEYEKATAALRQAVILKAGPAVSALLQESQSRLREQVLAGHDGPPPERLVSQAVEEAQALEKQQRPAEAVEKLQVALAIDPRHSTALLMQYRLTQVLADVERRRLREAEASRLMETGVDAMNAGLFDRAVEIFSRLLAQDPDNEQAGDLLWRAYSARNLSVPARKAPTGSPRLPPTIAFANTADAVDDQQRPEQEVASPRFVLKGVILSAQPQVDITILQAPAEGGSASPSRVADVASPATPAAPAAPTDAGRVVHRMTSSGSRRQGQMYEHRIEQSFDLPPGLTLLTVVADDRTGLFSSDAFRVRYSPPFTRSAWFYAAVALVALSAAGGARAYSVWRRGRKMKRRFNPYVAGAPVLDADLFIGREALLARILETVHNNSILLFGERRIGKTSLQHHLARRLKQVNDPVYDFYPVYVDLEGTPEERFFARLAEDIFEELSPYLAGLRAAGGPRAGEAYGYTEFARDVRDVLKQLRQRSHPRKARLVLLIDEVDELNSYDPRINQRLRSLFMKSFAEDLVAVVSGVGIKKHWASEGSPWYNFFEEIEVRPFTVDDARALIERPISGVFKLEPAAVSRIIENTDCKPYLIQKLCAALVNRMHDLRRRHITLADVDAIGRPLEEPPAPQRTLGARG